MSPVVLALDDGAHQHPWGAIEPNPGLARAAYGLGFRPASRRLTSFSRAAGSASARMPIARWPALRAPASPMATVATGIPAGIGAMDSRASSPPSTPADMGTPMTGSTLQAATTPGKWAAPP